MCSFNTYLIVTEKLRLRAHTLLPPLGDYSDAARWAFHTLLTMIMVIASGLSNLLAVRLYCFAVMSVHGEMLLLRGFKAVLNFSLSFVT